MTALLPPTWHPALWAALATGAAVYLLVTSPRRYPHHFRATHAKRMRFLLAVALVGIACGWPLGDLAAHVSLSALVVQRLLLMLAVPALALSSLPDDLAAAMTRPRAIDRATVVLGHPAVAVGTVTVLGTVTLLPAVVAWGARGQFEGGVLVVVTLALGMVLWLPILGTAPATRRLSHVAKGGYCFAASLVVTSLSFVWIFASHPLYPTFSGQATILGLSPLVDQQLAGMLAKLGAYAPLWAVGFVQFARAGGDDDDDVEPPLRWVDVQRELERADRRHHVSNAMTL